MNAPRYTATVIRSPGAVPRRAGRVWPEGATLLPPAAALTAAELAALRHTRGFSVVDVHELPGESTVEGLSATGGADVLGAATALGEGSPSIDNGAAKAAAPSAKRKRAPRGDA